MLVFGALCLSIGVCGGGLSPVAADAAVASSALTVPARLAEIPDDSVRPRPKAVEVSEWYGRRLTIHRYVAYGTLPVFAAQWAAGKRLYDESRAAPTWAKTTHRVGATALAAGFTVNTVTGLWNLWDSRSVPQGRVLRTAHALTMLAADAAFTYAGAKLSEEAEQSSQKRRLHRTVALTAMGVTTLSELAMKFWNH